jgi:predicted metal-dependent hydrolase
MVKKRKTAIRTRLTKNLHWLEKYLKRTRIKMPSFPMPVSIRGYKPNIQREMRSLGTCSIREKTITLATHDVVEFKCGKEMQKKLVPIPQTEILMTLAHEMAHLWFAVHNYEQERFSEMIFSTFDLKQPCPHCSGSGKAPLKYKHN